MKQFLLFFLLLNSFLVISQKGENYLDDKNYWNRFEYKDNFDLIGNVKEVTTYKKVIYTSRIDSTINSYETNDKMIFNKPGYLLKEYWIQNGDSLFLREENTFNSRNNILTKTEYARKWKYVNETRVLTNDIATYHEKFSYNNQGQLLTKYQKTSWESDFYLSRRNTYENEKLIKREELNNHIDTSISGFITCKGNGYRTNDFVTKYEYDSNNSLISEKKYIDISKRYKNDTINGIQHSIPILRQANNQDFTEFILERERSYSYDLEGRLTFVENKAHYKDWSSFSEGEIHYEYFGTKQFKTTRKNKNNSISGNLKEYKIINGDTLIKASWYLRGKGNNTQLEKRLSYQIKYNKDGSFIKSSFSYGKVDERKIYNIYKDLVEFRDANNKLLREIIYVYDDNYNWIEKVTVRGKDSTERIIRKITYY